MNIVFKSLVIAFQFIAFFPIQAIASSLPDFPFIGVEGVPEIEVMPDTANIGFSLLEFSEKPEAALNTIKKRSAQIIELAREFNISDDSIFSTGIESQIKRQINRDGGYDKTNIIGYEVTQSFGIKIDDVSKYSDLVDKLISIGNVSRIHPSFDVKNRKEILRKLVADAGKDAKQKALDLADAMDVKIKSVFAINQDTSFESFFATFGLQEKAPSSGSLGAAFDRGNGSLNMMVPKSIKIQKKIGVVYKLK